MRTKEQVNEYHRLYYKLHGRKPQARSYTGESARIYKIKWKGKAYEKLGGKCSRCGFDDWRALQIDHVNGGGKYDKAHEVHNLDHYYRTIFENVTGKYQLLCANCNWIKSYETGERK